RAEGRVVREDERLREHDPAATNVHERVRRAEIDRHVAPAEPAQVVEEPHRFAESSDRLWKIGDSRHPAPERTATWGRPSTSGSSWTLEADDRPTLRSCLRSRR